MVTSADPTHRLDGGDSMREPMSPLSSRPHPLLLVVASVWILPLFLAPLLEAMSPGLGALAYRLYEPVCHQLAERSYSLAGHPLGVCARCLGLYAGGLFGLLIWPRLNRLRVAVLERPRRLLWFLVPMAVDVVAPWDLAVIRLATGLLAALPFALVIWCATEQIVAGRLATEETSP